MTTEPARPPGVRMEYARAADGTLARAATAPKGAEHVYRCLECGERLKLRRGDVRAPHFSHLHDTNCTGEGVIHHAAKLELARALYERERPLHLRVPCGWPGCSQQVEVRLDPMLGAFTEAVTEYAWTRSDGTFLRFDVATLLHGELDSAFEVYHHHRVPPEKKTGAMPCWVEIEAVPLLEDPYTLEAG